MNAERPGRGSERELDDPKKDRVPRLPDDEKNADRPRPSREGPAPSTPPPPD